MLFKCCVSLERKRMTDDTSLFIYAASLNRKQYKFQCQIYEEETRVVQCDPHTHQRTAAGSMQPPPSLFLLAADVDQLVAHRRVREELCYLRLSVAALI